MESAGARCLALSFLLAWALFFPAPLAAEPATGPAGFVHAKGSRLVAGPAEREVRLEGVNFIGVVWDFELPNLWKYHTEKDYRQVAAWGLNSVRLLLSPVVLEEEGQPFRYKKEGWAWLDRNVVWAKKNGIYLVLCMFVPPGMVDEPGLEVPYLFHDEDPDRQALLELRLKALWWLIARRYRNEPAIAGFDLLNEPRTRTSSQWPELAGELAQVIRTADPNHLLVVERTERVYEEEEGNSPEKLQFLIGDPNAAYDFHFYSPHYYSHQYVFTAGYGEGGHYPDPGVGVVVDEREWADGIGGNPTPPPGDSGWSLYEGAIHQVGDPGIICAYPVFACSASAGTVAFDDFVINEYDEEKNFVRRVLFADIVRDEDVWASGIFPDTSDPFPSSTGFWRTWSDGGEGTVRILADGHDGRGALALEGVTGEFNLHNPKLAFAVRPGYHYQISGWMRGEGVAGGGCQLTLEFARPGGGRDPIPFDRNYLEGELDRWLKFSRDNNVPVHVGEFGLAYLAFRDGRGGGNWVSDMLGLLAKNNASYQYFAYRSSTFGIFRDPPPRP